MLKHISISRHPHEIEVGQLFSSEPLASNPKNRCAPFYDVLRIPDDEDGAILVMPLLYRTENPPFQTIGEVVEFFRQIFEVATFFTITPLVHVHPILFTGVATYASKSHRSSVSYFQHLLVWIFHFLGVSDCKYNNIMADPLRLYEYPPHPFELFKRRDFSGEVKVCSTRTQTPIKYYLVDFGLSRRYDPEGGPPLELPRWGGDNSVPEFLAVNTPCDPFPVDVYCLGNVIRQSFLKVRLFFPELSCFFNVALGGFNVSR